MDLNRAWAGKARRWAVSVFLIGHLTATVIWVMPHCAIRRRCYDVLSYYIMPIGLWQYWTMFAPNPQPNSITLEAEVTDVHGIRHLYAFPRVADYPWWRAVPKFRHPKFAANLGFEELALSRMITSRHAVRELGIVESAFPVDVKLLYQVRETPKPGGPPADPLSPLMPHLVASYHFTGIEEVSR